MPYTTQSNLFHLNLSQITPPVATTPTRIWLISWNQPKINITLLSLRQAAPQQSKASFDCIRLALSLHQLFESYVSFSFCINLFQVIWLLVSNVTKGFAETASLFAVNPLHQTSLQNQLSLPIFCSFQHTILFLQLGSPQSDCILS